MSAQNQKPGWKMVKFGEVVKNANLLEQNASGMRELMDGLGEVLEDVRAQDGAN